MKEIKMPWGLPSTIVDDDDYEMLIKTRWVIKYGGGKNGKPYAVNIVIRNKKTVNIYMHRYIMEIIAQRKLLQEEIVDHINGDSLDNRRCNLRIVSASANSHNKKSSKPNGHSSRYHGVCAFNGKWRATISINNKRTHIGIFDNETDAAQHFDMQAILYYGDNARLNFPELVDEYKDRIQTEDPKISKTITSVSSKYEGVSLSKSGKWAAYIGAGDTRKHLGTFDTEEEAHQIRERAIDYLLTGKGDNPIPDDRVNYSEHTGVTYRKDTGKWQAYINKGFFGNKNPKKRINVGFFDTEQEAINAREDALAKTNTNKKIITPFKKNAKSPYRGVSRNPSGKYLARIVHNSKKYSLGTYDTPEMAAEIYDIASVKLGMLGNLNFPENLALYQEKTKTFELPEHKSKTSKYKGVAYRLDKKKWEAYRYDPVSKKKISLGYYDTEEDAWEKSQRDFSVTML